MSIQSLHKDPERLALVIIVALLLLAPDNMYAQVMARIENDIVQSLLVVLFGGSFLIRGSAALGGELGKNIAVDTIQGSSDGS